jgi:hypothetical protein
VPLGAARAALLTESLPALGSWVGRGSRRASRPAEVMTAGWEDIGRQEAGQVW